MLNIHIPTEKKHGLKELFNLSSPAYFDMQKELVRTNEIFTSGIVNVPQNTPARLFFVCYNDNELANAKAQFNLHSVSFDVEPKTKRVIVISKDVLDNQTVQAIIANNLSMRKKKQLKRQTEFKYVFFELDSLLKEYFHIILETYKRYQLPVYYHRSMRGWHFLSVKPVKQALYDEIMNQIKYLNRDCPHVTMRIQPNKWIGEMQVFKVGNIQMQALHSDTVKLKQYIELQDYLRLKRQYLIVNYRQAGKDGNL